MNLQPPDVLQEEEKKKLQEKLTGLLFVPDAEVDDTRFELLYSDLASWTNKGPIIFQDFLQLGALDILQVFLFLIFQFFDDLRKELRMKIHELQLLQLNC